MNPIRLNKKLTCELLSIKTDALAKLIDNDPTFPKPYKQSNTRQSPVFFDYADLVAWHNQQKEKAKLASQTLPCGV